MIFKGIAVLRWNIQEEHLDQIVLKMKKNRIVVDEADWFEIVVLENLQVIGYCFFMASIEDSCNWYLGDLKVSPNYCRLGIAESTLRLGFKEIQKRSGMNVVANIHPDNVPSIELHKKLNFKKQIDRVSFNGLFVDENVDTYKLYF